MAGRLACFSGQRVKNDSRSSIEPKDYLHYLNHMNMGCGPSKPRRHSHHGRHQTHRSHGHRSDHRSGHRHRNSHGNRSGQGSDPQPSYQDIARQNQVYTFLNHSDPAQREIALQNEVFTYFEGADPPSAEQGTSPGNGEVAETVESGQSAARRGESPDPPVLQSAGRRAERRQHRRSRR